MSGLGYDWASAAMPSDKRPLPVGHQGQGIEDPGRVEPPREPGDSRRVPPTPAEVTRHGVDQQPQCQQVYGQEQIPITNETVRHLHEALRHRRQLAAKILEDFIKGRDDLHHDKDQDPRPEERATGAGS